MFRKDLSLGDLITHLDFLMKVIIYIESDSEAIFKGSILDVPWSFLDYQLDTSDDGEAIRIWEDEENDNVYLIIYLKE